MVIKWKQKFFDIINFIGNKTFKKKDREKYREIKRLIDETCPKYGNDIYEADMFAREVANSYTKEVEKYKNPSFYALILNERSRKIFLFPKKTAKIWKISPSMSRINLPSSA